MSNDKCPRCGTIVMDTPELNGTRRYWCGSTEKWQAPSCEAGEIILKLESQLSTLKAALLKAGEALKRTKKLTLGPSFELQDSIMCEVLEALQEIEELKKGGAI